MATNFFSKFPTVQYDISGGGDYAVLTDISRTVDINNLNEDKVSYYTYYNIQNGDRPDVISQKLYGNSNYYWTFFILNDQLKTGISNAWPLPSADLENMISIEYDKYSAMVIAPNLLIENKLSEGFGDFSVIPLDEKYLTSLKISTGPGNFLKANILKYDYAMLQLVVYSVTDTDNNITSSALTNDFLGLNVYQLEWKNPYAVTPVAASLTTGDSINNNKIKFTSVATGTVGNNISIIYIQSASNSITVVTTGNNTVITINRSAATSAQTLVDVINNDGAANNYVTAQAIGTATGTVINLSQTSLSGGVGEIPTDPKQLVLYNDNNVSKDEWLDAVIAQYDKIDGVRNGQPFGNYDLFLSGAITKDTYVFNKIYRKADTLTQNAWQFYKYAPYQYFKYDAFDSSIIYPDSAFALITNGNNNSPTNPNSISYYEKEHIENDAKQKIKIVRPDLIGNFVKTYFSILTS